MVEAFRALAGSATERKPELDVSEAEPAGEHADDGVGLAVYVHGLIQDRAAAPETALPEPVGKHDRAGAAGKVILRLE